MHILEGRDLRAVGGRDDGADTGRDAAPPRVIREHGKLLHADHVLTRL